MSYSRNLYALGERFVRRQLTGAGRHNSDVFERDPFKIQSYNFRYAERPAYPVQNYTRPITDPPPLRPQRYGQHIASTEKTFETYYYNPNFARRDTQFESSKPMASKSFYEHRRRKFLQDFNSVNTTVPMQRRCTGVAELLKRQNSASVTPHTKNTLLGSMGNTATNSPLLTTCFNRRDYLGTARGSSTSCLNRRSSSCNALPYRLGSTHIVAAATAQSTKATPIPRSKFTAPQSSQTSLRNYLSTRSKSVSATTFTDRPEQARRHCVSQTRSNASLHPPLERKRSTCSGCEININIGPLDSEVDGESVRIKIETDTCLLNNTDNGLSRQTQQTSHRTAAGRTSTDSFGIDKRLSKFDIGKNCNDAPATSQGNGSQQQANRLGHLHRLRADIARDRWLYGEQQREKELERKRAQQRERERERLREFERERDRLRLQQLEHEREQDRLRDLERAAQREHEWQLRRRYQAQLQLEHELLSTRLITPMPPPPPPPPRAMPLPVANEIKTKLYRPVSADRLPGMMPFSIGVSNTTTQAAASTSGNRRRAQRLHDTTRNLPNLRKLKVAESGVERTPRLRESTNGNGNSNASPNGSERILSSSNTSINRRISGTRLSNTKEQKLLNVQSPNRSGGNTIPIHTRLNNIPIRITTTSQPTCNAHDDVQFSVNRVRNDSLPPQRRGSQLHLQEQSVAAQSPYNVNINVFADNMHLMRV